MGLLNDPNCFWGFLEPHHSYKFCENQLCSIIQQPANTWTNIGYLIVAIVIWKSHHQTNKRVRNLFSLSAFCLFFGSTFFHASATSLGHMCDLMGMFFVSLTGLTLAYERYFDRTEKQGYYFYLVGTLLSFSVLKIFKTGSLLFLLQILITVFLEFKMKNSPKELNYKYLKWAFICQTLAFIIWYLDVSKIICDPDNHFISGHGIWHLMSAITIYLFYKSYQGYQFKNNF